MINRNKPSYVEEEIKSIKNLEQDVIIICYKSDTISDRILESSIEPVTLNVEYISSPIDKPETNIDTVISFETDSDSDSDSTSDSSSNSTNIFYIFLGAFFFILIILGLFYFAKKWNENKTPNNKISDEKSDRNIASQPVFDDFKSE